ncbi:MAG: hypothetical protein U0938_07615 [Thiobacillus sp.]|jgi:hypothetical protein|nr:hypothetical protein [Thiobacillus sp.]
MACVGHKPLEPGIRCSGNASLKAIRDAETSGSALGGERFNDEIEATLARSVRLATPMHPKKKVGKGMS